MPASRNAGAELRGSFRVQPPVQEAPNFRRVAAQISELDTTLTDSAIVLFERLTAQLFTRSTRTRDRSWSASKAQVGRLIRLFGGAIDAMVQAREQDRDPIDVLDEAIGWDRLVASRDEIAVLGELATEDPLSLAAGRYAQLRRFAPAFLDAFDFNAPAAGQSLQSAVELLIELNRSGERKLPDIVPMPFASRAAPSINERCKTVRRRVTRLAQGVIDLGRKSRKHRRMALIECGGVARVQAR